MFQQLAAALRPLMPLHRHCPQATLDVSRVFSRGTICTIFIGELLDPLRPHFPPRMVSRVTHRLLAQAAYPRPLQPSYRSAGFEIWRSFAAMARRRAKLMTRSPFFRLFLVFLSRGLARTVIGDFGFFRRHDPKYEPSVHWSRTWQPSFQPIS
jgi:hypothetical protein